jgi:hypothetical protein
MFEPFTQNDEILLLAEAESKRYSIFAMFCTMLLFSIISLSDCLGRRRFKINHEPGFTFVFFIVFLFLCASQELLERRKYANDLKKKQKELYVVKIINKTRSFEQNAYSLELDSKIAKFCYSKVTETQYQAVKKGDMVTLVYAPSSKFLFEVRI